MTERSEYRCGKASFEATRSGSPNTLLELEVIANEWREDFKRASKEEMDTYEDILRDKVGVAVYPETRTTRTLDSHENPLAQIQAAVLG